MKRRIAIILLSTGLLVSIIGLGMMTIKNNELAAKLTETRSNLNNTVKVLSNSTNSYSDLYETLLVKYNKLVIDSVGK